MMDLLTNKSKSSKVFPVVSGVTLGIIDIAHELINKFPRANDSYQKEILGQLAQLNVSTFRQDGTTEKKPLFILEKAMVNLITKADNPLEGVRLWQ